MSARSKFNKKSAPEIQPEINTEVESTEPAQSEGTEDNTEIQATDDHPVEMTGAEEINDQGDSEIVQDAQIDPVPEVAEMVIDQAEVNAPAVTDPEPESTNDEAHDGPLVADTAPVATPPVSQGMDAPVAPTSGGRDPRLPAVGSVISRRYKDRDLNVTVLDNGFEFEGHTYKSLSKLAGIISGQTCNGFAFFRLTGNAPGTAAPKATRQATRQANKPATPTAQQLRVLVAALERSATLTADALASAKAALSALESKDAA